MHVMIVGNHPKQLGLLSASAHFLGYTTDLAYDGDQAIQCHINRQHDLILISLDLTDYDSMSTVQAIRQLERTWPCRSSSHICGVARDVHGALIRECIEGGMNSCVALPVTSTDAIQLLRNLNAAHS